jgi:hypothetical protein
MPHHESIWRKELGFFAGFIMKPIRQNVLSILIFQQMTIYICHTTLRYVRLLYMPLNSMALAGVRHDDCCG